MQFPFTHEELIGGAAIFSIEGSATIEVDPSDRTEWFIASIQVDGCRGRGEWADVTLPKDHWLEPKIRLWLYSKDMSQEIDEAWDQFRPVKAKFIPEAV